jgi:hypothetical protein
VIADLTVFSALGPSDFEGMAGFGLDDDGDLDFAAWRQGNLEIYAGDGAGDFILLQTLDGVFDDIEELAHLDFDGDGDDDLLAHGSDIAVWSNDAGVMTPMTTITASWQDLVVADFGGNGEGEFISASYEWPLELWHYESSWETELLEAGEYYFGWSVGLAAVQQPSATYLGLLGIEDRSGRQLLSSWGGDAPFPTEYNGVLRLPLATDTPLLVGGDFDGDGSSTAFAYGGDSNSMMIELGPNMQAHCYVAGQPKSPRAAVGDVDGDGNDEIALIVNSKLRLYGDP